MNKKYLYLSLAILFFSMGIYGWKVINTGIYVPDETISDYLDLSRQQNLVYVGDDVITFDDIEWEFSLLTHGLSSDQELSPSSFSDDQQNLVPLKDRLVANMIERKLLFNFIKQDSEFNLSSPERYSSCIGEWQQTVQSSGNFFADPKDKDRLKNRLCEKSIILQYLKEVVFVKVSVSDQEIASFYTDNLDRFSFAKRVKIRQIVLASENEAKRVRHRVRPHNFERYAREVSISPEASNGGLLGPFAKGEMPRVFDVAFTMRRGEIRGIMKSTYGFHIIKLEKKYPKSKLSLSEARSQIERELKDKKQEEEYQKWVEMALSAVTVKSPKPL